MSDALWWLGADLWINALTFVYLWTPGAFS